MLFSKSCCSDYNFLDGCAAVAMLIKPNAKITLERTRVSHCINEHDFFKPLHLEYPIMKGQLSVDTLNCCLKECLKKYDTINKGEILYG